MESQIQFYYFWMHILWHVSLHQCGQEWGILSLLKTKTKGFFVQMEIEDDDDEALQDTNSLEFT